VVAYAVHTNQLTSRVRERAESKFLHQHLIAEKETLLATQRANQKAAKAAKEAARAAAEAAKEAAGGL